MVLHGVGAERDGLLVAIRLRVEVGADTFSEVAAGLDELRVDLLFFGPDRGIALLPSFVLSLCGRVPLGHDHAVAEKLNKESDDQGRRKDPDCRIERVERREVDALTADVVSVHPRFNDRGHDH